MEEASKNEILTPLARIPSLDGLRGCAILLVLLFHFTARAPYPSDSASMRLQSLFDLGWSGVDLFFVLSGFLITGLLIDAKGSDGYFKIFYARRALRILPLYYGALVVMFVLPHVLTSVMNPTYITPFKDQVWFWGYLQNYHYLTNAWRDVAGPFWTLAIEEQFYLVWPVLVLLLSRTHLLRLCFAVIVGALLYRAARVYWQIDIGGIHHSTPCRIDTLAMGSAIALLARESGGLAILRRAAPYLLAGGAIGLAAVLLQTGRAYVGHPAMQTVGYSAFPLAYAGLLIFSITTDGRFANALRSPVLRAFGRYSYSLYVINVPLMIFFLHFGISATSFAGIQPPVVGAVIYAMFMLLACFVAGWLSWQLYETPFLRLKRFFRYDVERRGEIASPLRVRLAGRANG
jgi:peptidoglycan/LPS O-acetylase OafA/YrhL